MADLDDTPSWNGVRRLEPTDEVRGGEDGPDNIGPKQLAQRTRWLRLRRAEVAFLHWQLCKPYGTTSSDGELIEHTADILAGVSGALGGNERTVLIAANGELLHGPSFTAPGDGGGFTGFSRAAWNSIVADPANSRQPRDIAYGEGRFVVVGDDGLLASSNAFSLEMTIHDDTTGTVAFRRVIYVAAHSRFVAVGDSGRVAYSDSGTSWVDADIDADALVDVACSSTGRLLAITATSFWWSDDGGETWTEEPNTRGDAALLAVAWGDGWWLASGTGAGAGAAPLMRPTTDGDWENAADPGPAYDLRRIVFIASLGLFVATAAELERGQIWVGTRTRWRKLDVRRDTAVLNALVVTTQGLLAVGDDAVMLRSGSLGTDVTTPGALYSWLD